ADAVSGRDLAGEDPLVSGAAVLRKRVSVRPTSVDFDGGHELGIACHRSDAAGRNDVQHQSRMVIAERQHVSLESLWLLVDDAQSGGQGRARALTAAAVSVSSRRSD